MKFKKETFVNYQYIDSSLKITNSSILSIFQDVVFEYAYKVNDGILNNDHRWFLVSYHVKVEDRPVVEDSLDVTTWSSDMKGFIAKREFEVFKDNKIVIKALANLTRYNIKENHIERMSDELYNRYSTDPSLSIFNEFQVEKVDIPSKFDFKEKLDIPYSYIDSNNHVNNVCYYDIANTILLDYLGTNFICDEFIIHYKEQIKNNEKVIGLIADLSDSYVVIIKSEDEKTIKSIIKLFK